MDQGIAEYLIVPKQTSDADVVALCNSKQPLELGSNLPGQLRTTQVMRFNLEIGSKVAMPATSIFILTIIMCLVGVFLIMVCQYNYVVSFRNKIPYSTCHLPEVFFPECINEKTALAMFEKEKSIFRDGQEFLDDDAHN